MLERNEVARVIFQGINANTENTETWEECVAACEGGETPYHVVADAVLALEVG